MFKFHTVIGILFQKTFQDSFFIRFILSLICSKIGYVYMYWFYKLFLEITILVNIRKMKPLTFKEFSVANFLLEPLP